MVQVLSILPLDLESTTFAGHTLATKPEHDSARLSWLFGTLAEEDQGLCESVQKGLKSRSYSQGPFVADGENSGIGEHALHHFHCLVRDALSN